MYSRLIIALYLVTAVLAGERAYNETLSMRAAHYSAIAYCKKTSVEAWDCGSSCDYIPETT
jgi:hypothetical protein